jgi:acetolactate synthase-1/2/3 large subunit
MGSAVDAGPLPHRQENRRPEPSQGEFEEAAAIISGADHAIVLAGNGVLRGNASQALRAFAHATGMGVAATFMGKGVLDDDDPHWRGTVGMQARDYELAGFAHADVVITVGYDLVEHAPVNWNPKGDKRIVCIDTMPAEVDEHFITASDLIGDIDLILRKLSGLVGTGEPATTTPSPLEDLVQGAFLAGEHDDAFPMHPPRLLWELRQVLGRRDILVSDVGLHKLWIARMFPAHEPNTVFIANGLAGMGIALPTGIAAKLVHPERKVVTVSGDGGFLMNCQELETAARLKLPVVNVIWENRQYGSIVWKQDNKFGRHFGVDFTNPDFVQLAQAFGIPGFRCERVEDFATHLAAALELDVPSIVVVPIDYSIDIALQKKLGKETVAA